MPADRAALGAFLRSRRDRLTPAQAGIAAFPGPRRVPGLRKEELAVAGELDSHAAGVEPSRRDHHLNEPPDVVGSLHRPHLGRAGVDILTGTMR